MIFGDSFIVSKKTKKWLKVRIKEDGYKGYVQNKNFSQFFKPTHKINVLKAKVYKFPNQREKVNEVSFGSKIKVLEKRLKFYKFSKGWIKKKMMSVQCHIKKTILLKKLLFTKILNTNGVESHLKE